MPRSIPVPTVARMAGTGPSSPAGVNDTAEALARDPEVAAVFDAFSPSARRDYCEWIADAKRDATREKRVVEAIGWIREGKKRHWKYESC